MTLAQGSILVIIFILVSFFGYALVTVSNIEVSIPFIFLATLVLTIVVGIGFYWYNHNTASGQRYLKDWNSELNNGIEREITITAEDGRKIFHYEGKFDVESDHTDNYIKFESEEGKRYIIYYGITDTVEIIEK